MSSPAVIAAERWRPVVGYEGLYEVSDCGRVRSLPRRAKLYRGTRPVPEKILSPYQYRGKHPYVVLCNTSGQKKLKVHRLVLAAFVGPCPDGMYGLHWNDDRTDNRLANLRYGSLSDNMLDRKRNGNDPNASRTRCSSGHEYSPENTHILLRGVRSTRQCRACWREAARRRYWAAKALKHDSEVGTDV
jgi:hypothetical protein